jgi:type IV pilus assembly protein PilC
VSELTNAIESLFKKKLSHREMIYFFNSISAMDKVGISILSIMELMKDEIAITDNLKSICSAIYKDLSGGSSFSIACKRSSPSFTDDYVGLISIAERTGRFSNVFDELVEYLKWIYDISDKSKKAFRGPAVTMIFMMTLSVVMSIVSLPKIIDFLKYFNMEPPFYTKALIVFSSFLRDFWPFLFMIAILTPIATSVLGLLFNQFAITRDRIKLTVPIFGSLLLKIDTSRFIAFFTLMYNSGAEMLDIIEGVSRVVKNKYISNRIMIIHQKVTDGSTIFRAVDEEKIFPPMFRKMLAVCEATGEVGPVLQNVRFFYDKETKDTIEKVIGIIKPTMTILLGGMLMWIGVSMLGPIYANIANLGDTAKPSKGEGGGD